MNANLFFDFNAPNAIPLYLLSPAQYDELETSLTAVERNYFASHQFRGNLGDFCSVYNEDGVVEKTYIGAGSAALETALAQAALLVSPGIYQCVGPVSTQMAVAWALAQYRFINYKKQTSTPRQLMIPESEFSSIQSLVDAVFLVRDLINKPANDMGPHHIAEVTQQLAETYNAHFEQWVGEELRENNFPAIHTVGRASIHAPRLLSLTWGSESHKKVTLVGKGVCFDSGGLDIKSSSTMRLMKKDMAGAAHVLGLAQWIMQENIPVRLRVLIPAVENAIGPDSFRPGDVITMRNGLTVEVDNTDAEGRLILADALVKACEEQPDVLIDFATLTGAARSAVGTEISALFCNNDEVAAKVIDVSNKVRDPIWRLPLFAGYEELLNSPIADMANCSTSPFGGAIIAGLFLQRFIEPTITWLHFDMMGWNVGNKPGKPEGGEAMGVRAVAYYLSQRYG